MSFHQENNKISMKHPILFVGTNMTPDNINDIIAWADATGVRFGSLLFKNCKTRRSFTRKIVNEFYRKKVTTTQLDEITKWISCRYPIELHVEGED